MLFSRILSPCTAVVALALLVPGCDRQATETTTAPAPVAAEQPTAPATQEKALPRLVDLGAKSCIPCKMMAPILEELTKEYEGRMIVKFIDVWQNPAKGKEYGVQTIPTQIFYGTDGKELHRHVGFLGKEDILAKWRELGYSFSAEKGE